MHSDKNNNLLRELLRLLVRSLGILTKDEASCCGITLSQCHTIVEIGRNKSIFLNDLANLLDLDKSTMSRTVNNLVSQGLVERKTSKNDRRYIEILLTDSGNKIFNSIEDSMNNYYSNILNSLPNDKKDQVIESLGLLIKAIKQNKY